MEGKKKAILLMVILLLGIGGSYDFFRKNQLESLNTQSEQASWEDSMMKNFNDTVLQVSADAAKSQILYLWEPDHMPSVSEYTQNDNGYFDDPDLRPYLTSFPVPEETTVKGAVLLCAGGAFSFRGNEMDTIPVARELNKQGYQCFVVDYRLRPYTQQEGALDLARAFRFVKANAEIYGVDEDDIAVMGFSAGGILAGEFLINFDGDVNGSKLDPSYLPDELDDVTATADLPPTYFCYGTQDPFVDEFEANMTALKQAGVSLSFQILQDTPHGFGPYGNWIDSYVKWLETIFHDEKQN